LVAVELTSFIIEPHEQTLNISYYCRRVDYYSFRRNLYKKIKWDRNDTTV